MKSILSSVIMFTLLLSFSAQSSDISVHFAVVQNSISKSTISYASKFSGVDIIVHTYATKTDLERAIISDPRQFDLVYTDTPDIKKMAIMGWVDHASLEDQSPDRVMWKSGLIGVIYNPEYVKNPKDWKGMLPFCLKYPSKIMLSNLGTVNTAILSQKIDPSNKDINKAIREMSSMCSFKSHEQGISKIIDQFKSESIIAAVSTNEMAANILNIQNGLRFHTPEEPKISWSKSIVKMANNTNPKGSQLVLRAFASKEVKEYEINSRISAIHDFNFSEYPLSLTHEFVQANEVSAKNGDQAKLFSDVQTRLETMRR